MLPVANLHISKKGHCLRNTFSAFYGLPFMYTGNSHRYFIFIYNLCMMFHDMGPREKY